MARGKQKKSRTAFLNSFKDDVRGRRRSGKGGGRGSIRIFDDEETLESNLAGGLVSVRGRGKKREEAFQLKYSRRYEDLVFIQEEMVGVSNSMSSKPSSAKRKSSKRHGAGLQNDASNDANAPVRGNDSVAHKNRKMRKSGSHAYNTVVYNYGNGGVGPTAITSVEVCLSFSLPRSVSAFSWLLWEFHLQLSHIWVTLYHPRDKVDSIP
ncbi:hypothetical protein R1sor_022197 [Riccia sorocarpa]|uniref:Uncharacterized protein n=1 Tax=Riccia sorocarpa TaxID=122646 RepID=A0ABD3GMZ5_9MARC